VQEVASSDKFMARLIDLLTGPPFKSEDRRSQNSAKLYTIVPRGQAASLTRENQFVELVRRAAPHVNIVDLTPTLDELRKVKSPAEIELLQRAIDITGEAQRDASQTAKPGAYEYEVQGALEYAFTRNGAERAGFPSIVGSGINSTVLHYNENRKKIEDGDLVVVDIGAEYGFYTADITRTYPASGKFTARQREVYQLVLESQRAAEKAFKPGQTTLRQLQQAATDVMRASSVKDKNGNTLERYFIHGLGHWLGMDVHDVGDYSKGLPPGSVITIEPGIYIPDEKLGVRIEDDYLVTETGLVKMSARIPSDPDEIERLMSNKKSLAPSAPGR
jgi:Xaa-Pro aminopeptidase